MEIFLGVSMTPTAIRMVLVEGAKADGVTVDHDVFDVAAGHGSPSAAADQVLAAIAGTQRNALASGHNLIGTGVTAGDHHVAGAVREHLAARGIGDVAVYDELAAAVALAQAVGGAVSYSKTALMFIDRDSARLSVVNTADGSTDTVLTRSLEDVDLTVALTEMADGLNHRRPLPDGLFVVGSDVDVAAVRAHLERLVPIPVHVPDDAALALARGAALAAASAPRSEGGTDALAYSQDPPVVADGYSSDPFVPTQLGAAAIEAAEFDEQPRTRDPLPDEGRKPFLLVGSSLTAIFVIGVVALVISVAVSILPTADERPTPGESLISPPTAAPAPAPPRETPPTPELIEPLQAHVPLARQAPRTVLADAPALQAPPPAPAAPLPPPGSAPPPIVTPPPAIVPVPIVVPAPFLFFPRPELPELPRVPDLDEILPPWVPRPEEPPVTTPPEAPPTLSPPPTGTRAPQAPPTATKTAAPPPRATEPRQAPPTYTAGPQSRPTATAPAQVPPARTRAPQAPPRTQPPRTVPTPTPAPRTVPSITQVPASPQSPAGSSGGSGSTQSTDSPGASRSGGSGSADGPDNSRSGGGGSGDSGRSPRTPSIPLWPFD